jgi:hypothetical protein
VPKGIRVKKSTNLIMPPSVLDTVILFPTMWQDPSTCHYGAKCELQVYKRWGKYRPGHVCKYPRVAEKQGAFFRGSVGQWEPLPFLLTVPADLSGRWDFQELETHPGASALAL